MSRFFRCGILLALMAAVLLCTAPVRQAAAAAVELCLYTVIPSLFPFFVLSSVFLRTGSGDTLGRLIAPLAGAVWHLSPAGASALVLGLVGGYPVGARSAAELRRGGIISAREAAHLTAFCNNAGPAFLLGFVGEGVFGDLRIGLWLWGIHVLSALTVGLLTRPRERSHSAAGGAVAEKAGSALLRSVPAALGAMGGVCAYVIFFACLTALWRLTPLCHPLFLGSWELTMGVTLLSADRVGFVWAAVLTGWGGLSVFCQSAALLRQSGIPIRSLLAGKLLHALLSGLLARIAAMFLFP